MHCCRDTKRFELLSTIQTRLGLHIKFPKFLSAFNQIWISRQIYAKVSSIKFHKNPSGGCCVDTCRQPDGQSDRHADANRCFFATYANAQRKQRRRNLKKIKTHVLPFNFMSRSHKTRNIQDLPTSRPPKLQLDSQII